MIRHTALHCPLFFQQAVLLIRGASRDGGGHFSSEDNLFVPPLMLPLITGTGLLDALHGKSLQSPFRHFHLPAGLVGKMLWSLALLTTATE